MIFPQYPITCRPSVLKSAGVKRPSLQRLPPHEPFNSMKAAAVAQLQNIVPNTPGAVCSVAGYKALEYFGSQHFVCQAASASGPV